jgi:predicted DNA-binding protein with PD1-like motif
MKMIAIRLKYGQDLKNEIENIAKENNISSGYIATCVGSLTTVSLRMAGAEPEKQDLRIIKGKYEIVSLVGTISPDGSHLHLAVSDSNGSTIGGHLKSGSIIDTTAEIVIGYSDDVNFQRIIDKDTGFKELIIINKQKT